MMLLRLNLFGMLMLWCCWLMDVKGQDVCQSILTQRINLTTKLQSEILLPCYFDEAFIKTNQTPNAGVVWTHINETFKDIVEVTVSGEVKIWNSRDGKIKAFSYISGSGNFSILIRNVTKSDLGLYYCKLFRETNCLLGYMEINISLAPEVSPINNWLLMLGGGGVLLCLVIACVFYSKTKSDAAVIKRTYTTVVYRSLP